MEATDQNNVKIYNLSSGKSLPEWLSDRKRRALLKKDVDIRRRIELIQDFDMPGISNTIKVSRDGQYILVTGTYKPRIKCFEVNNLSLKFERCFDSEAITFEILSDDYSKLVFLQNDRYIEFHSAAGRYYRLRIPKFGRDMKYHSPSGDLFVVGASSDIYRLNLSRGQFMAPFESKASAINKCAINPVHNLLVCGTDEGRVEAWDPRSKTLVGTLDCAFRCVDENKQIGAVPAISALKFNGSLNLAVGTSTGQVLLYDIRKNEPYCMKYHNKENLPVKDVEFHYQQDLVYSMDSQVVKIWNQNNGELYTYIKADVRALNAFNNVCTPFNNLCVVPNTGLFFIANEQKKIQTYYVPSLGPAPKWASFLDSLTEELEESNSQPVYDDYQFVTKQELENLNLEHLIGTNLLKHYMHGYFMDMRLYRTAKSVANPFEFEDYRRKKVKEIIEKERINKVQIKKLPKVNRDLALKLMSDQNDKKKKANAGDLLEDNRFTGLFENPDFEVDKNTDEYRLLNPVLSRLDQAKKKEMKKKLISQEFQPVEEELEGKNSSDESSNDEEDNEEESSDDEHNWTREVKKQHRIIQREHRQKERLEAQSEESELRQPKLYELRQGEEFKGVRSLKRKLDRAPLGERLAAEDSSVKFLGSIGNREMTFSTRNKRFKLTEAKNKRHREERKNLIRPLGGIKSGPTFSRNKRKF